MNRVSSCTVSIFFFQRCNATAFPKYPNDPFRQGANGFRERLVSSLPRNRTKQKRILHFKWHYKVVQFAAIQARLSKSTLRSLWRCKSSVARLKDLPPPTKWVRFRKISITSAVVQSSSSTLSTSGVGFNFILIKSRTKDFARWHVRQIRGNRFWFHSSEWYKFLKNCFSFRENLRRPDTTRESVTLSIY